MKVMFEFADSKQEIADYFSAADTTGVDYVVFRMPPRSENAYEVYKGNGCLFDSYRTFEDLCGEFVGNKCCM